MQIEREGLPQALVVDALEIPRFGFAEILRNGRRFSKVRESTGAPPSLGGSGESTPEFTLIVLREFGNCTFELIERFCSAGCRVLVVSSQDERLVAARALSVGARGVVNIGVRVEDLLSAVDRILGGEYYLASGMMQQLFRSTGNGRIEDPVDSLSRREIDIFRFLSRGMTAREISLEVHLSPKTVEYHRQRIKEKLHMATTADLIRYATMRVLQPLNEPAESPRAERRRRAAG